MNDQLEIATTLAVFLAQLELVPWFCNLGHPIPADAGVERIFAWDEWPGPEEPAIGELHFLQQEIYDQIMAEAGEQRPAFTELWDRIHAAVFRRATSVVPFDPNRDAWYGPTTAVWHAAWTAGLVGLCLHTSRPIPPELQEQWSWFIRGHWPSGYASREFSKLVVF